MRLWPRLGLHPDWVLGISIGAINAAIIAGNAPERRVDKLRGFWEELSAPAMGFCADVVGLFERGCQDTSYWALLHSRCSLRDKGEGYVLKLLGGSDIFSRAGRDAKPAEPRQTGPTRPPTVTALGGRHFAPRVKQSLFKCIPTPIPGEFPRARIGILHSERPVLRNLPGLLKSSFFMRLAKASPRSRAHWASGDGVLNAGRVSLSCPNATR